MVNADAAVEADSRRVNTGVAVKDKEEKCIAADQSFLPHVIDAPMESFMHFEGLMPAQHIG
jgi:hypothetical protein